MLAQERNRALPRVGRGVGVERRAEVAVESVLRVGVPDHVGGDGRTGEGFAELVDVGDGGLASERERACDKCDQRDDRKDCSHCLSVLGVS